MIDQGETAFRRRRRGNTFRQKDRIGTILCKARKCAESATRSGSGESLRFDQPLEGAITTVAPKRGTEGLTPHYHFRQPLQAAVFLCLLILVTRKRVHIFFDTHLICSIIFFQLIADVFSNNLFIASHSIHIISSAPKVS